jgi:pyruvate dehydrogenase E2 component (dihydrolipoamide acetyltransferase)
MEAITVPKLGQTMEKAVIEKWHVKEGDTISKGDVVLEITTDKATLEVESYASGTVRRIVVPEGEEKEVGSVIAFVGDPGEEIPDVAEVEKETKAAVAEPEPEPAAPAAPAKAPAEKAGRPGRVRATPRAKKLAREMEVDLAGVTGTGPGGRITEDDVKAASSGAPAAAPAAEGVAEKKPLSAMRRIVAERMAQSAKEAPHYYLNMDVDMTTAVELREKLKADYKLSYNDMIVRACATALSEMPDVNSTWLGDGVGVRSSIDIGIAVGLEDGLIVPVVRQADKKSLEEIASAGAELIEKARGHKLLPDDYGSASMTVSNLGMFGVASFQPVVNLGESVILGVGAITERAVGIDGEVALRRMMTITLSCDHRVVDGAVGAQFLARVRELLEKPEDL